MEAEEDIKSETSGILQELLLALAKVRRTGLQGREGLGETGEHCSGTISKRRLWREAFGWFGLVVLEMKSYPSKSPPERVSSRGAVRATLESLTTTWWNRMSR